MSKYVYIDLDGTLTDPFEGISNCITYAMERLGHSRPDNDSLNRFIGPPLLETFAELVGALNNGFRAIGVTWGYGTTDELLGAGADCVAAAPTELAGLL